jgi:uncharacterized membrane protein YoaK (UPF0700 family)
MSKNASQKLAQLLIQNPTPSTPKIKEVFERQDFYYIILGSSILALCAGYVNVVGMLVTLTTVSHGTGTTTKMGIALGKLDLNEAFKNLCLIISFCLGSMIVGFFSQKEKFHYSRKYGIFMLSEGVLLFIVRILLTSKEYYYAVLIMALTMGIQNALFTNFSGAVVRTTHVTGLLTDIGLIIGHLCRGKEKNSDTWRLKVLVPIYFGFMIGAMFGCIGLQKFEEHSLYIPILILGIGGVVWTVWRLFYKRKLFDKVFKDNSLA